MAEALAASSFEALGKFDRKRGRAEAADPIISAEPQRSKSRAATPDPADA